MLNLLYKSAANIIPQLVFTVTLFVSPVLLSKVFLLSPSWRLDLSRLEEEDGDLSEVEVDEVLGLVGDVGAEVAAHDAVPGGVVLLVELLLDEGGDVLLDVVLLEGLGGAVDSVLLHVLCHVGILDHGLAFRHLEGFSGCS